MIEVLRFLGIVRPVKMHLTWQRTLTAAGRFRLWHAYREGNTSPICGSGGPRRGRARSYFGAEETTRRPSGGLCKLCAKRTQQ